MKVPETYKPKRLYFVTWDNDLALSFGIFLSKEKAKKKALEYSGLHCGVLCYELRKPKLRLKRKAG